jgi:hypothetical protein
MPDFKSEIAQQLQELELQERQAPLALSEAQALQLRSQNSVSRALLLLLQQLSQSATGSAPQA